ncbi:NAD+ diphosphatase [Pontibacter ummariensis]|uniref:NAD(+) diphosphatase n=1 Tax=Pontibacter ummariensis TaxID=1610492 RepID=A0A239IQS8_9BACT|nr:NAD(+) diphosphatase [Pontibacter ummariensis]PRY09710.1 NAD+ diphosphatase [Pontibacter ummariensis]SNS95423.1 NAD+ diphosphatase [Pontibacter ummariensis]
MNYFSHTPLYRFSELRADEEHIDKLWRSEQVRVVVVSDTLSLLLEQEDRVEAAFLTKEQAAALEALAQVRVYLGSEGDIPYFALGFEGKQEELLGQLGGEFSLQDLRTVALELPKEQAALLSYARAIVHWNLRHQYCPDCGSVMHSAEAGHVRKCSGADCNRQHYPRTDTAVIVLISEGDACLLGRQATWPQGQYATIAGFLEPGETLEQAVAREAKEETGVELESIAYHSSQPWPFPSSIMVGFSAVASSRQLKVNHDEMDDARWFTRNEIAAGLKAGDFRLPPPVSIAYRLIRDWFNSEGEYGLEDLLPSAR